MTRAILALILVWAVAGCGGEAEAPRFAPAPPGQAATTPRPTGDDAGRLATPPKNIATH